MSESLPLSSIDDGPPPRTYRDAYGGVITSLLIHGLVCLLLAFAMLPLPPLPIDFSLMGEPVADEVIDEALALEETAFEIDDAEISEQLDATALDSQLAPPTPDAFAVAPEPTVDLSSMLSMSSIAAPSDSSFSVVAGVGTDGRSAKGKAALVAAKGGSPASEAAVARGLKWLEKHQNRDGSWSLFHNSVGCRCGNPAVDGKGKPIENSTVSATGLALLPFLGAGETHQSGRYRKVVRAGLEALIREGKRDKKFPEGLSWADSGRLYSHGIASIVLGEAYGLTQDPDLLAPARAAMAYTAIAQDPLGGGWRYTPQKAGDTSVTGWQIMALKSGMLAGLNPPRRLSTRAIKFLDSASAAGGTSYGYLAQVEPEEGEEAKPYRGRPTMAAVGLLCRMYLGWDQSDPRLAKGVKALSDRGPIKGNFYHNYYASQVIFHQTGGVGPVWRKWNEATRDMLIEQQATRGHERGSWWEKGGHTKRGGRLYCTAMATMTLEVYYRYLPLYKQEAVEFVLPD